MLYFILVVVMIILKLSLHIIQLLTKVFIYGSELLSLTSQRSWFKCNRWLHLLFVIKRLLSCNHCSFPTWHEISEIVCLDVCTCIYQRLINWRHMMNYLNISQKSYIATLPLFTWFIILHYQWRSILRNFMNCSTA